MKKRPETVHVVPVLVPTENELMGTWLAKQTEAGAVAVDTKAAALVREGVRHALDSVT